MVMVVQFQGEHQVESHGNAENKEPDGRGQISLDLVVGGRRRAVCGYVLDRPRSCIRELEFTGHPQGFGVFG